VRDHGVTLDKMLDAPQELAHIRYEGYLEMHIEEGPVRNRDHGARRRGDIDRSARA
jgi:hypothetical protein